MPELDAIRGIAILMVVFYHGLYWSINFAPFPAWEARALEIFRVGRLGVNLFFVLSGFLITGLLLNARTRPRYYRNFYIRRGLRILPAYLATLLVLVLIGTSLKFIGLSFIYLSNPTPLFGVAIAYPVLWSLAVEEHFYLLWPAIVRKLSPQTLAFVSAAIIISSPFLRWLSFDIAARSGWVSFEVFDYTWNSADGLACGALLSIWLGEFSPRRRSFAKTMCVIAAVGLLCLPLGILSRHEVKGAALSVVPWHFLFVALIGTALLAGSRIQKPLRFSFLEFFGEISYGLYLYHLLVFEAFDWLRGKGALSMPSWKTHPLQASLVRFVICGTVAVAISYLSRRYFENRFLRLKGRFAS